MKNVNDLGLFDDYFLLETLSKLGDPLQKLSGYIDWTKFEATLNQAFRAESNDPLKRGRPPFNKLLLFKALIIQSLYDLSDDQLEFQILDRASFKRFLGLKKSDKVPNSKTFWLFREQLIEKEVIMGLFKIFNETLDEAGVLARKGKMMDTGFLKVNRRSNSIEKKRQIREPGLVRQEGEVKSSKPIQKNLPAKRIKKNKTTFYGYRNHRKNRTKT